MWGSRRNRGSSGWGSRRSATCAAYPWRSCAGIWGPSAAPQAHLQAHGIADHRVYPLTERQSISKETTFPSDVSESEVLRDTLRWAAQEVGYRHEDLKGSLVTLKIRLHPFETHTRSRTLPLPTANDLEIFRAAWDLFQAAPWSGRPVRLIGLGLSGWEPDSGHQPDLFDRHAPRPHPREERLDATLDAIRDRFGRGIIQRGLNRRS